VPLPRVVVGRPRGIGPVGGTSGGGSLTRRATTAATVVTVLAAAITAIVVFVVVLGPVATGATISAIGQRDNVEDGGLAAGDATLV
jgi:hypothetical protein